MEQVLDIDRGNKKTACHGKQAKANSDRREFFAIETSNNDSSRFKKF